MEDIADYFGFGKSKPPAHRGDVTTCPCTNCKRTRGTGAGLKTMFGEIRGVMYLKWMLWKVKRARRHWPQTYRANPEELEKEGETDARG